MGIGYFLACEEFAPAELLEQARMAQRAGFDALWISDHYHPWIDAQGQSPFVWSMIGALSQVCDLPVTTAVTCPTVRTHPAIIAQAAATSAVLHGGRFVLGVGSGEALNEHIYGDPWPRAEVRLAMLEEAIHIMRELWEGGFVDHDGEYYTVENARIYTLPETPPPIHVAASGAESGELAGMIGDGLISTSPDKATVQAFDDAGGTGKPKYAQVTVCWATDEDEAKETALKYWGYTGLPGQLSQELALPQYFQEAAQLVTKDVIARSVVCGPDAAKYHEQIRTYVDAGFTHVYIHQVGPDQDGFFQFAKKELLPTYQ
jgi:G6PDH family F420-dependent oxidoreductase